MTIEQAAVKLGAYMHTNFSMLPRTAEMAAKRYVTKYLEEKSKTDLDTSDLPDFGNWLADKFLTLGIINEGNVQKLVDDFKDHRI